ncbi:MAG: universal stress protein [Pseudomonadota bacterium]
MSYKTILVHADHSRHAPSRIAAACALALGAEAHLVGLATHGLSRFADPAFARTLYAPQLLASGQHAGAALDAFERGAAAAGVPSSERRLVEDEPASALALHARYADLVVLSQSDPDDPVARSAIGLPEYVLLAGARPALVVPYAGRFERLGQNVLAAWDGGLAASRALSAALPLLRRAGRVTLALFNPHDAEGRQPGADIALWLARHGVRVELSEQPDGLDAGQAMLSLAAGLNSDLLVMGCYGHARLRELVLGGATETILRNMTVPVLMSH